jgi:hypothetical protein
MKISCCPQFLTWPHLDVSKDSFDGRIVAYENILMPLSSWHKEWLNECGSVSLTASNNTPGTGYGIRSGLNQNVKKKKKNYTYAYKALRHEDVWGSWCIDLHIRNLTTSWRWVVSLTPRPLNSRYPLDWRLGELQSRSGQRGKEKNRTAIPRTSSP